MSEQAKRRSKFLSLVLRHEPSKAHLVLDEQGWTPISDVMHGMRANGLPTTREDLEELVRSNDKQRFAISSDGRHIRANQGHSVDVDLAYAPAVPPEVLYHGTVAKFLESIRASGLIKGGRHHVHLSAEQRTAEKVGQRRGVPVLLEVRSGAMHRAGMVFHVSDNGVWLTESVPPEYLSFP